jgi:hypothetical protein
MIYIDGNVRPERTPAILRLPTGKHRIEIVRDGDRQSEDITVQESMITNVSAKFDE